MNTDLIWHLPAGSNEPFCVIGDYTIIERNGFWTEDEDRTDFTTTYDVFQQINGDEVRIAKRQTLDDAIATARR